MTNISVQNSGFSLVEALVAIAILLTVISGVMVLVNQSIQSGENVTNRLAASYLASDAIEYLRYERDTEWLNSGGSFNSWVNNNLSDCIGGATSTCRVDTRKGEGVIEECSSSNFTPDCTLQYNSSLNEYGHSSGAGWEDSRFTRTLEVLDVNGLESDGEDDEIIIEVRVSWPSTTGDTTELVLTDTLTSWGD